MNTWTKKEANLILVGITKELSEQVDEFLFIKLPDKGPIEKGAELLTLEAAKWSVHVESPVSGEIVEVNENLYDEPSILNKNPDEWIVKIKE